jgi:antitoxin ParD1/3/4
MTARLRVEASLRTLKSTKVPGLRIISGYPIGTRRDLGPFLLSNSPRFATLGRGERTMNVSLTPELEALVRRQVETGQYSGPDQVLREALQLLEERDRQRRLRAALAVGDEQYARGEVVPWTPELMDQLKQQVEEMARQGKQPNPDVCP